MRQGRLCAVWLGAMVGVWLYGVAPARGDAPLSCAIIGDRSLQQSPLIPLLSQKLATGAIQLVEREQVANVLKEQEIGAALGAGAGAQRVRLGALLKAEVLLLLKSGSQGRPSVEVIVCECSRGLRLFTTSLSLDDQEKAATALAEMVGPALAKARQPITEIAAVSAFVCNDLSFRYETLKRAYARVVEQVLIERPGLVVVELDEARAIASEIALTGDKVTRPLPLYFLGEFRHEQGMDNPALKISVAMKRGEQLIETITRDKVDAAQAGDAIKAAALSLLRRAGSAPASPGDAQVEAGELARRAKQFMAMGNRKEALTLIEASLLLKPGQTELHHDAVIACGEIAAAVARHGDGQARVGEYEAVIECYLRGLEHLEEFLRVVPSLAAYQVRGQYTFVDTFRNAMNGWGIGDRAPTAVREAFAQGHARASAILLRIAEMRLRDRRRDECNYLIWIGQNLPERQRYALFLDAICRWKDQPGTMQRVRILATHWHSIEIIETPEAQEFLKALGKIDNSEIQAGLRLLQTELALSKRPDGGWPRRKTVPPATRVSEGPTPEALFHPVQLSIINADKRDLRPVYVGGWIRAGEGIDVLWSNAGIYVMKEKGKLKLIWKPGELNASPAWLIFDGKYVWAPIYRIRKAPRLLVLDPASERSWEVTAADGLPQSGIADPQLAFKTLQFLRVAPVAPGRACVVGTFGRSWLAMADFGFRGGSASKVVKLFHEAREQANPEDASQWQKPTVAFAPSYVLTISAGGLTGQGSSRRVLIGRETTGGLSDIHPLLVDPESLSVQVLSDEFCAQQLGATGFQRESAVHDGGSYVYWLRNTWHNANELPLPTLYRSGFPDFRRQTVGTKIHPGEVGVWGQMHLFFFEGRAFIAAKQWWVADALDKPFLLLKGDVPERGTIEAFSSPEAQKSAKDNLETVRQIYISNHYGLICVTKHPAGQRVYQVELTNLPPAPAKQ